MTRCDFSDLPVESCSHCTGRTGDVGIPDSEIMAVFVARFPGKCGVCDGRIEPGDKIGKLVSDHDVYACTRCLG